MALFNSGYPVSYQPMVYPSANPQGYSMPIQTAQNGIQNQGIIWVQGEAGAKSYLVAPNNTVQLWDSEEQVIYLKSADASGMPSMKVLDYTIRETVQNGANKRLHNQEGQTLNFATKDELRAVSDQITAIQNRLNEMEVPKA